MTTYDIASIAGNGIGPDVSAPNTEGGPQQDDGTNPKAGVAVVSTCEEMAYPFEQAPELAAALDAAGKAGGAACLGEQLSFLQREMRHSKALRSAQRSIQYPDGASLVVRRLQ